MTVTGASLRKPKEAHYRCECCGLRIAWSFWTDYFCPECSGHQDQLYRREHRDPMYARVLTKAGIRREYELAGQEWRAA